MAKRFKLRIFRLMPSFQNFRSKDPSVLPLDPHPIFFRPSPTTTNKIDFPATPSALHVPDQPSQPTPKPHHSSLKRHVSAAIISVGSGFRSRSGKHHISSDDNNPNSSDYRRKQDEKWHVIAPVHGDAAPALLRKIQNSSVSSGTDADVLPSPPLALTSADLKNKKRKQKKKCKPRIRISTSSDDSGWFSSEGSEDDDGEETETFVSSRSISTDCSSDFNPQLKTINESPTGNGSRHKKSKNPRRVRRLKRHSSSSSKSKGKTCSSPVTETTSARLSVFQRLNPCTVDGKVRESFAVIKRSEDPYEDFKRSMFETIVEKQMFEARELEQLLHCFLSLNSRQH